MAAVHRREAGVGTDLGDAGRKANAVSRSRERQRESRRRLATPAACTAAASLANRLQGGTLADR